MSTIRLIVNADDYGITESISKGILEAHTRGIVTSVSIITNTPVFDKVLPWIKDKNIDTGIHLTLNSGKPLSPSMNKLPITTAMGAYRLSPACAPSFYFASKPQWKQCLHDEFRMQVEKLLRSGITITHLDSHYHVHVLPSVACVIAEIVKEYKIPFIRRPYEPDLMKRILNPVHAAISFFSQRYCTSSGVRWLPFYGLTEAGRITKVSLMRICKRMVAGCGELMVHPGYDSPDNRNYYLPETNHFENELRSVTGPAIFDELAGLGIRTARRNEIAV